MATALVLVDTCIWVSFFNRRQTSTQRTIDDLLDQDRVAIIGPILAEVLLGFRRDAEADWVASNLRGLNHIALAWDDCAAAARLGRLLKSSGHSLPLSDLALAACALANDCEVYTTDPHFDPIPDLKRFQPP